MKNQIRLLCVALIVIFCISLYTVNVYATPEEENTSAPSSSVQVEPSSSAPTSQPDTTAPTVPDTSEPTEPTTDAPSQEPTQAPTQTPTYATQTPTVAPSTSTPTYAPQVVATDPVSTYYEQPETSFTNSILDVDDEDIDDDTLNKKDWDKIADKLQKSGKKNSKGDFSFIQNTSAKDNSNAKFLIIGIFLIILGACGIVALIVYKIRKHIILKKHGSGGNGPSRARPDRYRENNSSAEQNISHPENAPASHYEKKELNRRSKYDTDEVYTPRRTSSGGTRGRQASGGTRYRPKH